MNKKNHLENTPIFTDGCIKNLNLKYIFMIILNCLGKFIL